MSAAAVVYFLFAIIAGQSDAASLTTLGSFRDIASCEKAALAVKAALTGGTQLAPVFCASSADLAGISKAARPK